MFPEVYRMKVALCVWLIISVAQAGKEDGSEVYTKNNPLDLKEGKVFYTSRGKILDLYSTDKEIRNILSPHSKYLRVSDLLKLDAKNHPPIFFNLYKNGHNEGVFLLKNQTAIKIRDGSDSVANYPNEFSTSRDDLIFISASDGIYTYNPENEITTKFGNISDKFLAIDKVSHKDEIYVLGTDNKIYKVTDQGTVKTKVEGIDYAKDFVLDLKGAIYFLGEDNKPQVLYKGSVTPVKITGLNFDVKESFLSRPLWDISRSSAPDHLVPFTTEGVSYVLLNSSAIAVRCDNIVPGLTSFSAEYSFIQFYGEKGHIYMHSLITDL